MVRKIVLLTMVSAVAFATVPVAAAWTGVPSSGVYQTDDELSEEPTLDLGEEGEESPDVADPVVVEELDLGERFTSDTFALEVQGFLTVASVDHNQLIAVRASVALQNLSDGPLVYTPTALTGEDNYPELQLVDSAGEIYEIDRRNPQRYAIAGSSLQYIPNGLPAHWTVGWQVPVAQAEDMVIQAIWNGDVVAEWDLESEPSTLAGFDAPEGMDTGVSGDTFTWSTDEDNENVLTVEVGKSYAHSCGHPELVVSAATGYVPFFITNDDTREAYFPGVAYPDVPMYAVWADGSSARYSDHGAYFEFETGDVDFERDLAEASRYEDLPPLEEWLAEENAAWYAEHGFNSEIVRKTDWEHIVYPEETDRRLVAFPVPRFGPLVNQLEAPTAILVAPPTGEQIWFNLDQVADAANQLEAGDVWLPSCDAAVPSVTLDLGLVGSNYHLLVVPETESGGLGG